MNRFFLFLAIVALAWSCKKDDETDVETVPPRLLSEVAVEDDAEIREYLQTHFYNYEEFAAPPENFDFKIKIDTIAGENAGKTPLMEQVESEVINVPSSEFGRDDGEEIQHTLYYLKVREGVGKSPTIGDFTVLHYEGLYLDGNLFDASSNVPSRQYLPLTVRGYGVAITHFKTGIGPIENGDGTVSFDDYGIGMIFIPSGLGYFDDRNRNQNIVVPAYTPVIFKVDVLAYEPDTDFDKDGIPSILEDLNGDGNLGNDNTDKDIETQSVLPNHIDPDDDGDGTPTSEEIVIDANGNITFPDTDGDGTPDYLDKDSK